MAKLILICGKICSGKTTYAKRLMLAEPAVRLNPDEVMIALFGTQLGDRHEVVLQKTLLLLYEKALEIYESGISVILDCGFWQRAYREQANAFFEQHGVRPQWHYLDVSDAAWQRNIHARNEKASSAPSGADYEVTDAILEKFQNPADVPSPEEMDVLVPVSLS